MAGFPEACLAPLFEPIPERLFMPSYISFFEPLLESAAKADGCDFLL
jgi:hypothetical protein